MTSVFAKKALLPSGWVDDVRLEVDGAHISAVQRGVKMVPADESVGFIVPGLCNAHCHAFQRALAGHTEQRSPAGHDNFWSWRERMYALAARVDAASLLSIARQAYSEMLCSGYTSVVEFHYLHRDPTNPHAVDTMFAAIHQAAIETGIRLTYVPVHYERAGFGAAAPQASQHTFAQSIDEFLLHRERAVIAADATVNVGVGVHSLRAVSSESLQEISAVAADASVPMHLHIAEQEREVEQCMAAYGRRPVRYLLENFKVSPNWCLVHATHMDVEETAALAESGAVVALCPSTEANLGDGLFPLHDYLAHGGQLAIGSDSNISINPFEELRWLEYGQRLVSRSRNVVSLRESHVGSELYRRALDGGAMASGQTQSGIQAKAAADFVVLNDSDPMLAGHGDDSRLDALVFSGFPLPVERVMVNGQWRVVDAVHVQHESVRAAFVETIARFGAAT